MNGEQLKTDSSFVEYYVKIKEILNQMELDITIDDFVILVLRHKAGEQVNPLTKGFITRLGSMILPEGDSGKNIAEIQTIEKLCQILGLKFVYTAILSDNFEPMKQELSKLDVNYDELMVKLRRLNNGGNTDIRLASKIDKDLLCGFEQRIKMICDRNDYEIADEMIKNYKGNLFTKEVSAPSEDIISYDDGIKEIHMIFDKVFAKYKKPTNQNVEEDINGHYKN